MLHRRRRIRPLIDIGPIWEHESSRYPDVIRVPMRNGAVIRYRIEMEMPHPSFTAAMDNVRTIVGYQYKEPEP